MQEILPLVTKKPIFAINRGKHRMFKAYGLETLKKRVKKSYFGPKCTSICEVGCGYGMEC